MATDFALNLGEDERAGLPARSGRGRWHTAKRALDLGFCVIGVPLVGVVALILLFLNPRYNRGPVFYVQERMGRNRRRFRMVKFRTMEPCANGSRSRAHDAPLEEHRVTRLGHLLRRTRIDELPNFLNVLTGEMSVIGPRPDAWDHAVEYAKSVPFYASRFRIRPGITGLAQVKNGYADTGRAIRRKARLDHFYVGKGSLRLDFLIIWQTAKVLVNGFGAR